MCVEQKYDWLNFCQVIFFQNNKLGEVLLIVWLWISISLYQGLYLIGTVKIALLHVLRMRSAVQPDKPFCRYTYFCCCCFFCTDMIVQFFFTEPKSQNKCPFSIVVVHLVLELQHENHVASYNFKFSTLKQCLRQTALSFISRQTLFKYNKQFLNMKQNKPVGDKIVRFRCEFKEINPSLALSPRCRFHSLE